MKINGASVVFVRRQVGLLKMSGAFRYRTTLLLCSSFDFVATKTCQVKISTFSFLHVDQQLPYVLSLQPLVATRISRSGRRFHTVKRRTHKKNSSS